MPMIFAARRPTTSTKRCVNGRLGCRSDLGHEPIEHCQKRIDNRLAKRTGGLRDLVIGYITGSEGQIAALLSDDGAGSFDRPLGKVAAVLEHRFDREFVGRLRFLLGWRCSHVVAR